MGFSHVEAMSRAVMLDTRFLLINYHPPVTHREHSMGALILGICWSLAVLLAIGFWFLLLKRARSTAPCCPFCGHDVRGLTEPRCVECGRSLEHGVVPVGGLGRRRRWGLAGVILLMAGVLSGSAMWWGTQVMFDIAKWRHQNKDEVDVRIGLTLDARDGERFTARFRGVDFLEQQDIVRISFRIEEPDQAAIVWEQEGPGRWTDEGGVKSLDGTLVVADLASGLDGEPRGIITRALLEDPEGFALFLETLAVNPGGTGTRIMLPDRTEPFLWFDGAQFDHEGSRAFRFTTNIAIIPSRLALGIVLVALCLISWIQYRPGLVDWKELDEPTT